MTMTRSGKNNPCPVCGRTKDSDCSWYPDSKTVLCHSYQDGVGHDEAKWHYTGQTDNDTWGKFVLKEEKPEFTKPDRPKAKTEYFYPDRDGNPLVRVTRTDDGNGTKNFYQSHWNGSKWVKGCPKEIRASIPIYRYLEVREAIDRDEPIFIVEGEGVADTLWGLGIAATTTIGGSGGYKTYGEYLEDLEGARLILCPDRDDNGLKYIANFVRDFPEQIEGYYLAGTEGLWRKPEGGMDIGDDIKDHNLTKDQILAKVITPLKYQELIKPKPNPNPSQEKASKQSCFTSSIENGLEKVICTESENGKETKSTEPIGSHLEAIAYVNNPTQDSAGLLLQFKTIRNQIRRWTMPRADLAGDGSSLIAELLSRDYVFNRKQKSALLDYLHGLGADIEQTYIITDSSGWVQKSFVLPHKTYGDENLRFRDVDPSPEAITEISGTLQGWKDNVAFRCAGNSRLILALGTSFAAPLLPIVNIESGGFHLVGATSQGKTTILSIAASVTGIKDIPHWRTTTNGLESTATAFNHLCLPLDEIGQADPRDVGNIAYMLANGQGKARMKRDLTNRQSKIWQLMVLSSGEVGMGSYMQQANINQKGGQEVRLPDIPAIPDDSKYGCFETIHGADTAVQFVGALEASVKEHHGIALDAFLSHLVNDMGDPTFASNLSKQVHLTASQLAQGTIDAAIGRVAKRFALVQVSLGLAHKYGLLPFPVEEIEWAISTVFRDWLRARGGDGSIEIKRAIDNIQHLLLTNEFSDRVYNLPDNNDRPVRNLLAYRKLNLEGQTEEFLVPPSVFDREFCNGVNKSELVKELQRLGIMLPPREDGKHIHARRVNGKKQNFYVFPTLENAGVPGVPGVPAASNSDSETSSATHTPVHLAKSIGVPGVPAPPISTPPVHLVHLAKSIGVPDTDAQNHSQERISPPGTPGTPGTPPKTQIGNFLENNTTDRGLTVHHSGDNVLGPTQNPLSDELKTEENRFKISDRVRYVGRLEKYKGIEGVVEFECGVSIDVKWDSGAVLGLLKPAELEVIE
jgi:putative DNA primase/helicase